MTVTIDRPGVEAGGVWWLDIAAASTEHFAVEWSSRRGIGLHTRERPGYGEGPDETFEHREEAWERLKVLVSRAIGRV